MLRSIESVILFVDDIDAAAGWYAEIFETDVRHENPRFAFVHAPGMVIGFHPADEKCPGGIGGTTVYWEVDDLSAAIAFLQRRGATLHRGPGTTDFGAEVAMLVDPFGCTIGLNRSTDASRPASSRQHMEIPHLPDIDSLPEFDAFRMESERWHDAVAFLVEKNGLSADTLENLGGGNLIVGVGETHVVKLAPRPFRREIDAGRVFLQHAPSDLPLPVPRLFAAGDFDSWVYVIETRLPGETLGSRWEETEMEDRLAIVREIGGWLAALHRSWVRPDGVLGDAWSDFLSKQIAACAARQSRWGVPSAIVDGIADYLERSGVTTRTAMTMLHADLTDENVLLERAGSQWRISSVIDFGDARLGDPLYDLITPALLIARGDRRLLEALLDGYGLEPSMRNDELRRTLMAYSILHPFNDLTRYTSWGENPPETIEQLAEILYPWGEKE